MSSRALVAAVAPLVLAYLGWLAQHAWLELNESYRIVGISRTYQPPHALDADTWVIDPRPGSITDEIRARYAPSAAPPATTPRGAEAWRAWLSALGLDPRPTQARASWAGVPRLLLLPHGPELVTGRFDASARAGTGWQRTERIEHVVFRPTDGVCLRVELSPVDGAAFDLHGATEAPW